MPPSDPHAVRRDSSRKHASRIDRDYFRTPGGLQRARRWLVLAGLAAGVGWCVWGAIDRPAHHSPGPVASVHAAWEHDCAACHVGLSPIKDDTWLSTDATRAALDATCAACHRAAAHHPLQPPAEAGSCSACHGDHRGRDADITRVADRTCTACHADIAAHRLAGDTGAPAATAVSITRFDAAHHPPFASLATDPGRLAFSHGRHMRPGLTFGAVPAGAPAEGGARPLTYAMLPEADRGRYLPATAAAEDPVRLQCASCHEFATTLPPDERRLVAGAMLAAPAGAHPLPVSFERHCAACHALPYEAAPGSDGADGSPLAGPGAVMPHAIAPDALVELLEGRFLADALAGKASPLDEPRPPRPLPAARADDDPRLGTLRRGVAERVGRALTFARGTCGKCHLVEDARPPAADTLAGVAPFRVPDPRVPDVWFAKARFDHGPHQSFECRLCHAAASPETSPGAAALSPLDNARVMIAGLESCVACHAPAGRDALSGSAFGGARFDCVECHDYHRPGAHPAALVPPSAAFDRLPAPPAPGE